MIMKAKKMYSAPKMERVDVEIEAPIAASAGGGGYSPINVIPGSMGGGGE